MGEVEGGGSGVEVSAGGTGVGGEEGAASCSEEADGVVGSGGEAGDEASLFRQRGEDVGGVAGESGDGGGVCAGDAGECEEDAGAA